MSKLATARDLAADTAGSSLGWLLQLSTVDEVELYCALDWLGARQAAVEAALARRHLNDGALVLNDVSSSWLKGRCCALAGFGYSRGCPVAVKVFAGNTADSNARRKSTSSSGALACRGWCWPGTAG